MGGRGGGRWVRARQSPRVRHRAQRLAWVAVLLSGVSAYLLILRALVTTGNVNFYPSLLLVGAATAPATVVVFAWGRHSGPKASTAVVVATALAGGVIGTVVAGTLEYRTLGGLDAESMLGVAVIEEGATMVVPVVLLLSLPHADRYEGVVIGIASGAGFATLETMGYGLNALLTAGSVSAVDQSLLLRGLTAPAGHIAWTGMTVAAVWRIPTARDRGRAVGLAVGAFALAVLLHAAWDGVDAAWVRPVVGAASLGMLLLLIARSGDNPAASSGPTTP